MCLLFHLVRQSASRSSEDVRLYCFSYSLVCQVCRRVRRLEWIAVVVCVGVAQLWDALYIYIHVQLYIE